MVSGRGRRLGSDHDHGGPGAGGLLETHFFGQVDATPTDDEIPDGTTAIYVKSDGNVYKRPTGGSESQIGGGGGGPISIVGVAEFTLNSGNTKIVQTGISQSDLGSDSLFATLTNQDTGTAITSPLTNEAGNPSGDEVVFQLQYNDFQGQYEVTINNQTSNNPTDGDLRVVVYRTAIPSDATQLSTRTPVG